MSLKDLISTLIESAFTSKKSFIAKQSLSSGAIVSQTTLSPANEERTAVAPCDGFAVISSTEFKVTNIQANCKGISSTYANPSGETFAVMWVPVSKGETLTYFLSGASGGLRFIRSIGGGA